MKLTRSSIRKLHNKKAFALVSLASMVVAIACAEAWYTCQDEAPLCPEQGATCNGGLGAWDLAPTYETDRYACNGRGDCGRGVPSGSSCNVWAKCRVKVRMAYCMPDEYPYGLCVVEKLGSPQSLNARCDNYLLKCKTSDPLDPIPSLTNPLPGNPAGTTIIGTAPPLP